ncbi:hypothetical protein FA10DRAFT_286118 [Acaromyces ingoldii]|uniref:Uncharacterized protein n=1 Tax=Acaromyces ingoldii TaxID=215250 RepID=A0A316YMY9_9BASI|nr:hypothetical protein FA10DRAFT_286118 [Acaromyces ingoldii]PWN90406.1 hypothetical protein FA10DRAFT_286118 [Acaromyces ingoldii]
MPPKPPLTPDQKRIRVMVVTFPVLVASSVVLVKRLFLGEQQRELPVHGKIASRPA